MLMVLQGRKREGGNISATWVSPCVYSESQGATVPAKTETHTQNTMKNFLRSTLALAVVCSSLSTGLGSDSKVPGYIDFGKLPQSTSGEFVEVQIRGNLIAMAARFAEKDEPEVAKLLSSIQLVRVNVITLDDENRAEIEKRVKKIRSDLDAQGWERVVAAQQKDQDVGIYLKTRGEESVEGIVVTVLEGKGEAVLINIVGDLKPEKIATIGERLNIDPLKKVAQAIRKN